MTLIGRYGKIARGDTMLSKLDQFRLLLSLDANYMPPEYGREIFHYTSPSGFLSILFGNQDNAILWASRFDCLNDMSEGAVAESVFHEVWDDLLSEGEISEELHSIFATVRPARTILLPHYEGDSVRVTRPECDRYICSFSKNSDSLALWNYYSKGSKYEGFNIGFFPSGVEHSLNEFLRDKEATFHIYPVVYDKGEQKRLVRRLLVKLIENYEKDQESLIRYYISNYLLDWSLVFKSEYFSHEEEVRIIVDVAKREKRIPVEYRITSGYIVPYIKLPLEKTDVSYAMFGPLQCGQEQKQHQLNVMEEMMEARGYSVLVEASKVPVRY